MITFLEVLLKELMKKALFTNYPTVQSRRTLLQHPYGYSMIVVIVEMGIKPASMIV